MPRRITSLTEDQKARFGQYVQRFTQIGLSCEEADWETFESGVRRCYSFAELEQPKAIVRVDSPIVLNLAAPIAALLIEMHRNPPKNNSGAVDSAVRSAVRSAVDSAVHSAVHSAVRLAVGSAVDSAVDSAVGSEVYSAVGSAVRSAVHSAVHSAVGSAVRSAIRSAVGSAVRSEVYSAVDSAVHSAVDSAVDSAVRLAVGSAVGSAVHSAVGSAVYSAVRSAVDSAVRLAVGSAVRSEVGSAVRSAVGSAFFYIGGQFWISWHAYLAFFRELCGLDLEVWDRELAYLDANSSACWWYPHKDFVMVCNRPEFIRLDERGRLHSDRSMSIRFRDGWGLYHWHGVSVPADVIMKPYKISPKDALKESNAEVRRAMIERIGMERFVSESGARLTHSHERGDLFSIDLPGDPDGRLNVVRVKDPSTSREYFLRVPPQIKRADDAVAWTFGFDLAKEYAPVAET